MISDNNLIYDTFFVGGLPPGPTENVFSHLDAEGLRVACSVAASPVSADLGLAWKQVAKSLGYPVDPAKNPLRNYNDFVKDLVVRIGKYPDGQVPADIREILKLAMKQAPSVVQVRKLQEFIRARDTLVVWGWISKQADITVDFSKAYESAEVAIERAKGFTNWIDGNSVKLQELVGLNLNGCQLSSIPEELRALGKLEELALSNNQLTSIPEWLGALRKLTMLYLSGNQLTSIPECLGKLQNLWLLKLSKNQLTSIPKELGALGKLNQLNLSENQLTSIPKELGQLQNLMNLDLYHNQLESIPRELRSMGWRCRLGEQRPAPLDPRKDHGAPSTGA